MKTYLLNTEKGIALLSDEDPKTGDIVVTINNKSFHEYMALIGVPHNKENCFKVIASEFSPEVHRNIFYVKLPKLDLSLVLKSIGELWDIFDVEELAKLSYKDRLLHPTRLEGLVDGFVNGAETILAMNKEKVFTREDAQKIFEAGGNLGAEMFGSTHGQLGLKLKSPTFDETISSLRPNLVECNVVEEENQCDGCKANLPLIDNVHQCDYLTGNISCQKEKYNRPKIVNNRIKVLTLIK